MITFSTFCHHWNSLKGRVNATEHRKIGQEAFNRLQARFHAGRGDRVLCFADLSERLENLCSA